MNDDSFDRGGTMTMEEPSSTSRIVPLSELHSYKIASGDPDVRGWTVIAGDGQAVGRVDGLLVDTAELKVRYLDVALGAADGVADAPASPPENVTADAPVTVGTGIVGTPGLPTYGTVTATGAMAGVPLLASETPVHEPLTVEGPLPAAPSGSGGERHVLIPVGSARLAEDRVFVEGLGSADVALLPAYDRGEVTPEQEAALFARFDRAQRGRP